MQKHRIPQAFLQQQFLSVHILRLLQSTEHRGRNRISNPNCNAHGCKRNLSQWRQRYDKQRISAAEYFTRMSITAKILRCSEIFAVWNAERKEQAASSDSQHSQGSDSKVSSDMTQHVTECQAMWMLCDQYLTLGMA